MCEPRVDALHARFSPALARLDPDRVQPLEDRHYGRREVQVRLPDGDWTSFGTALK